MALPTPPEPLSDAHELDRFDCGIESLNDWLKHRARRNDKGGASRTFVAREGRRVVGYYSLAATSITHAAATGKMRRNMPDPVPAVLIGRLAVDRNRQALGMGSDLLFDAVVHICAASQVIGIRVILVHALTDQAAAFYENHGFERSVLEHLTLMTTVADARAGLGLR